MAAIDCRCVERVGMASVILFWGFTAFVVLDAMTVTLSSSTSVFII